MSSKNALLVGSALSTIKSWNKRKIVSFLADMTKADLLCLICSIFTHKDALTKNRFMDDFKNVDSCRRYLVDHCIVPPRESVENKCNPFTSLPSDIGAHILSFCRMPDRLHHAGISKDLYKFSMRPGAKYHLLANQSFAFELQRWDDSLKLDDFYNAKYLELKYDSNSYMLEKYSKEQYFTDMAQLVDNSPQLHTIEYDCIGFITSGHFLEWLHEIQTRLQNGNAFDSVTRFIYIPSKEYDYHDNATHHEQHERLRELLPNLTSLSVAVHCRRHYYAAGNVRTNADDAEWVALRKTALPQLRYLCCDMVGNMHEPPPYAYNGQHFRRLAIHPLSHFYKLKNLQSLKLRLLLFPECHSYYKRVMASVPVGPSCECDAVRELHVEFVASYGCARHQLQSLSARFETDSDDESGVAGFSRVVSDVCALLMRCCPNVAHYTLLTNQNVDSREIDDHLMGKHHRLVSLDTDCCLNGNIRMGSLHKLVLHAHCEDPACWEGSFLQQQDIEKQCPNLKNFPNLQVFKLVVVQTDAHHRFDANINAIRFLQYLIRHSEASQNTHLEHVGISHRIPGDGEQVYLNSCRPTMRDCGKSAERLCHLVVVLTSLRQFTLETIELQPIVLKPQHMEYLYFWFNGHISTQRTFAQKQKIFTDLTCTQIEQELGDDDQPLITNYFTK